MPASSLLSLRSPRAMTIFAFVASSAISASGSAPTPLYRFYEQSMGLTPFMLTLIFAVYPVCLLAALLTVGSLSDYIGRRPVIFAALGLNMLAMALFIHGVSPAWLIAARIVQGFATGAATTTLGAAILDTDRARGALLNSVTAFIGLTIGSLGSGILVAFAPAPTQLIFILLLSLSAALALIYAPMPETAARRAGALTSLRPHVRVPREARATFQRLMPVNVAAWSLGGFYFSLMPSLLRVATGETSPLIGGIVVAALTMAGTAAVLALRNLPPARIVAFGGSILSVGVLMTLSGAHTSQVATMLIGTLVAGFGFGGAFSGVLRTLLPMAAANERAGLLSAFYVVSYLAFSLPAILAGLAAPILGLTRTTDIYAGVIVMLALISLVAAFVARGGERAGVTGAP
jgi:MFS family permease